MTRNLGNMIRATDTRPALIAVGTDGNEQVFSYAEFDARCYDFAAYLRAQALPAGSVIGLLAANHADYMAAFNGIMRAGHIACPINWKAGAETIAFVANDCEAKLIFFDREREALCPSGVSAHALEAVTRNSAATAGEAILDSPKAEDIACIMYTSGSTGRPKGVPISHNGYCWGIDQFDYWRPPEGDGRILISAPLYHMNGQCDVLINLSHGSTTVLMERFDVALFLKLIESHRITEIGGVPTMLAIAMDRMETEQPTDTASVTSVNIGSAPLSARIIERLGQHFPNAKITNGYGTTETGFVSFGPHPGGKPRPPASIGYPVEAIDWRFGGDEHGRDEMSGELWLRTEMMAKGYLNRPDATAERFIDGWYRAGDIVRRDADGFFYIIGRADDMFVCAGENIYPGEIEKLLEKHPSVSQASVIPVEDETKCQVPVAFVVRTKGASTTEAELQRHCRDEGPVYAYPRRVQFLDALPLASTNKIDKHALKAMLTK